ncbi:DUF2169 family type VI secretion system accessory protein [Caldimonas brevitalea]|uniref:DUF2169 domain-containing protein n=1 Tax=Caldimonas brevitalea TaxID=413882 RepID=A0A0G3BX24_9BURK|nr:DUF2169 domain-containing protein [Caldimonas brevitalea]AKJ31916.1 hypothetical protein AAW51_5225 [Caldimonas brevitalea]
MRIFKPQSLSVLHRCFERQRRAYLGVSVVGFIPLGGEPALLPEVELWQLVPPLLGDTPLDVAVPKLGAEYLVTGSAFAPGGKPVQGLKVSVRLGGLSKDLHVFGARCWAGDTWTAPQPFVEMPLGWEQAYGGPQFDPNPQGRGHAPLQRPDGPLHLLPQVEYPARPSVKPHRAVEPASFAPLGPMSAQRKRFDGSYDEAWLQQDFPGTPADLDWRYFCLASEDQWQPDEFVGDEQLELIHLHPGQPRILGRLPGIRPVVVVRDKNMAADTGRFLETRLTTVWFFPNQLRAALIWHALMPVTDEFADQVELMCVGAEWIGQPRAPEHYLQAMADRLDEQHGGLRALDDADLLPAGLAVPNESLARFQALMQGSDIGWQRHQARMKSETARLECELQRALGDEALESARQQQARALKLVGAPDLSAGVPSDMPSLIALARQISAPNGTGFDQLMQQAHETVLSEVEEALSSNGVDPSVLAPFRQLPGTACPRDIAVPSLTEALDDMERTLRCLPTPLERWPDGSAIITPEMRKQAAHSDEAMQPLLRAAAHVLEAPARVDAQTAEHWRHSTRQSHAEGKSFAGITRQGADFRQMDLSGADFSTARLEGADFTGATLTGACFDQASLAHARFTEAQLQEASFVEANLGKSDLSGAMCLRSSFREANLTNAVLAQANLNECEFDGASLIETDLRGAQLVSARLEKLLLLQCQLGGASFTGARLDNASFVKCDAAAARFEQAQLASADFVACDLDAGVFDGAAADNVRFVLRCTLRHASFKSASLRRASLRGLALEGADFQHCCLDGADLGESRCAGADFTGASLREALLTKAGLQVCRFIGANLMHAILQHAQLQGADLSKSNLFSADVARIDVDRHTRWDGAYTAKARALPAHKVLPPDTPHS